MATWLIIFCYCIMAYGFCNMVAFGSGPFRIFERLRGWADSISQHFGQLFTCMMCLPANLGWILSLIDWFLIPAAAFTPFNIIFLGTKLWWLAMILDCCFTTGIVWLIHVVDEWLEQEPEPVKEEYIYPTDEEEQGFVEIAPRMDKKTKKMMLND